MSVTDQLVVSVSVRERCTVVALCGESDMNTVGQVRDVLAAQVRSGTRRVVLDLSGLRFMGSLGMHALLGAEEALTARGATMALVCPQRPVARVLELTGTDQRIPVYDSLKHAAEGQLQRLLGAHRYFL
jgi:anti-anti-sigma factor